MHDCVSLSMIIPLFGQYSHTKKENQSRRLIFDGFQKIGRGESKL
jgi:hypothetical protein